MRKVIIMLSLLMASSVAVADQRFESWQGICHFAYDANDDDNEVYFANCENTINTYDAGDGQGRLAFGTSEIDEPVAYKDGIAIITEDINLKGADADDARYPDDKYTSANNTPCIMVTSNYDAGNDDNNETVYVTNDWNLEIDIKYKKDKPKKIVYNLFCRNGIKQ